MQVPAHHQSAAVVLQPPSSDHPDGSNIMPMPASPDELENLAVQVQRFFSADSQFFHKDLHANPPLKPPFSFPCLIGLAISTSTTGRMSVRQIYDYIEDIFPYYKTAKVGWKNSVRHNLSLSKTFCKLDRQDEEDGKGKFLWGVNPRWVEQLGLDIKKCCKKYHEVHRPAKKQPAAPSKTTQQKFQTRRRGKSAASTALDNPRSAKSNSRSISTSGQTAFRKEGIAEYTTSSKKTLKVKTEFQSPTGKVIDNTAHSDAYEGSSEQASQVVRLLRECEVSVDRIDELIGNCDQDSKRIRLYSPEWDGGCRIMPFASTDDFFMQPDLVDVGFGLLD